MITPVAFLIFRRPETTQRVFNAIREAKPKRLFVIADGGKDDTEWELCRATRTIIDQVDWDCEIMKNYSAVNLGCKRRVSSGIDWVFQTVDRAIILEDDCLPHPSFFPYCEELLERYKNNTRIMHIAGVNFQTGNKKFISTDSYYFSEIAQIWGWATWRRAWKRYEVTMAEWPRLKREKFLQKKFGKSPAADYWEYLFDTISTGKTKKSDTWDAQWVFACFVLHGLCVMPHVNLVSNIGFGEGATRSDHTVDDKAHLPTSPIESPLRHPHEFSVNAHADQYTLKIVFHVNRAWKQKFLWILKRYFPYVHQWLKHNFSPTHPPASPG